MKFAHILAVALPLMFGSSAMAGQVIQNGGFETGTFSGWTTSSTGGSSNAFYISSATTAPMSGYATPGAETGVFYALASQTGPGSQTLSQSFTKVAGGKYILSYDMFVNSHAAFDANNQFSRVDLLSGSTVLRNLFLGAPSETDYKHYSFDISNTISAAGTYQLRFLSLQNNFFQEQGVDNVSLISEVPEPVSLGLMGIGLLGLALSRRKQK